MTEYEEVGFEVNDGVVEEQYRDAEYEEEYYDDEDYEDADEETEPEDNPSVRFPSVKVKLIGTDGNSYALVGKVEHALRHAGATPAQLEEFRNEAFSGDRDHLLATLMEWVVVW